MKLLNALVLIVSVFVSPVAVEASCIIHRGCENKCSGSNSPAYGCSYDPNVKGVENAGNVYYYCGTGNRQGQCSYTIGPRSDTSEHCLYRSPTYTGERYPGECPGTFGDPHFMTVSGKRFDYHGACDMVVLSAPDFHHGLGLDIHIRSKARYQYSYIETAALKIGDDVLEVSSFGQHFFNGVENAKFPQTMGGVFTVTQVNQANKKVNVIEVDLGDGETITMKSFKDLVGLSVSNAQHVYGKRVSGVLGQYNVTRDLIGRDGETLFTDTSLFAEEWQVRDTDPKLFQNMNVFPQWPEKCVRPKVTSEERRRLGEMTISEEEATAACEAAGRVNDLENCVYDVIATSDLEMVAAGAF